MKIASWGNEGDEGKKLGELRKFKFIYVYVVLRTCFAEHEEIVD
jgi:hypothetical protein